MTRVALGVEYVGTNYCGWQSQKHCDSVQQYLEKALASIAAQPISLYCAGRTDTGVHAVGQVVHFDINLKDRPLKAWVQGANTHLPGDIRVRWARQVCADFHARFSAQARQYRYVIYNAPVHSANLFNKVTWEPYVLNEQHMQQAGKALYGEQDFSAFRASSCQAAHARRQVQSLKVSRKNNLVFIDIKANAFLHHMVRNIAGSLIEVGKGRQPVEWIETLLNSRDRTLAAATAPASGLYFVNAFYPDFSEIPIVQCDEILWQ